MEKLFKKLKVRMNSVERMNSIENAIPTYATMPAYASIEAQLASTINEPVAKSPNLSKAVNRKESVVLRK